MVNRLLFAMGVSHGLKFRNKHLRNLIPKGLKKLQIGRGHSTEIIHPIDKVKRPRHILHFKE